MFELFQYIFAMLQYALYVTTLKKKKNYWPTQHYLVDWKSSWFL